MRDLDTIEVGRPVVDDDDVGLVRAGEGDAVEGGQRCARDP
jgi:hypothetical protein